MQKYKCLATQTESRREMERNKTREGKGQNDIAINTFNDLPSPIHFTDRQMQRLLSAFGSVLKIRTMKVASYNHIPS